MSQTVPKCICFDVDGVLLDSLPQHLKICEDLAEQFHLKLKIPSIAEMRARISAGLIVSPMRKFFLALDFPPDVADRALEEYRENFASRYSPQAFPGVREMLLRLRERQITLGLVTSNIRANVVPLLADCMSLFDDRCQFFDEPGADAIDKVQALSRTATILRLKAADCVYVGDQPSDEAAANSAGFQFLGVAYGWGVTGMEDRFPVAQTVREIPQILLYEAIVPA